MPQAPSPKPNTLLQLHLHLLLVAIYSQHMFGTWLQFGFQRFYLVVGVCRRNDPDLQIVFSRRELKTCDLIHLHCAQQWMPRVSIAQVLIENKLIVKPN